MVKARKEQEAHLAEEAKLEEQARENRRQSVLDSLVTNGKNSLRSFALTDRIDFNEQEAKSIYYSIMAIAQKFDFDLCTKNGVSSAVSKFLEGISWKGCTNFRMECVTNWTKLFAENNNIYDSHVIDNFISFIDYMSCNAKTNVTTVGSNGCADQLTNWDGTQKIGLGALPKKKSEFRPAVFSDLMLVVLVVKEVDKAYDNLGIEIVPTWYIFLMKRMGMSS